MEQGELETLVKSEKEWRIWLVNQVQDMDKELKCLNRAVAGLKVKAGIWGLMGGAIPVIIGLAIYILKGG